MRGPLDDRRSASGGWRERHGVPSARRLSTGLGPALGAGALILAATAATRAR